MSPVPVELDVGEMRYYILGRTLYLTIFRDGRIAVYLLSPMIT